jgi:hypothetical protein
MKMFALTCVLGGLLVMPPVRSIQPLVPAAQVAQVPGELLIKFRAGTAALLSFIDPSLLVGSLKAILLNNVDVDAHLNGLVSSGGRPAQRLQGGAGDHGESVGVSTF